MRNNSTILLPVCRRLGIGPRLDRLRTGAFVKPQHMRKFRKLDIKRISDHFAFLCQDYYISDTGRVYRKRYGRIRCIKHSIAKNGYSHVQIANKEYLVHRIVAKAFLERNDEQRNQVNHKNGNKQDNRVENLEWVTQSENQKHRYTVLNQVPYNKGMPMASSVKEKIRRKSLARFAMGWRNPLAKYVKCEETGKIYDSAISASRELGLSDDAVANAARDGHAALKKWHFTYVKGEQND